VKNAIIFGAIGLALSMIYVLFSVLFCPSIASEGDFVDYGVSVLDNAKDHRMNKKEFAVAAIAKAMNKEDVALVSTIGEKRFARVADELSDDLGQKIVYNMLKKTSSILVLDAVRCSLNAGDSKNAEIYLNSSIRNSKDEKIIAICIYNNLY
jgi:hypothetical protein